LGLAFSVLAGGFTHFASQWLWGKRIGAALLPERPDFSDPDLRRMMSLFLPYAAGLSLNQVNPVVSRMLGSFLEEGSISVLNYANRVIQLPLGLFVIAVSQAVLPQLSRAKEPEDFASVVGDALRFVLFVVLPTACGLIFISEPLVHLIFVRGAFGETAWRATSQALALSALGLPGMACSTVVMRGLYALSIPRAAFVTTLFSVSCTAALSFLLMFPMGRNGLALAPSVAFSLSGLLGLFYIRKKIVSGKTGRPPRIFPLAWCLKNALALAIMLAALALCVRAAPYDPSASLSSRVFWCLGFTAAGAASYAAATLALRFEEWRWIKDAIAKNC
jgi:putative peptidoglycan lipid II flippase